MLKDPECAARYEESMRAMEAAATIHESVAATPVVMFDVAIALTPPPLRRNEVLGPIPSIPDLQRAQEFLADLPQVELTPVHYFAESVYGRELFIPADTVVVGKIHRHEHLVMLMSGEATINTERGVERIVGPKTWVSPVGTKRILYTHTDCTFFTVHVTSTRDLDALEAEIIEPETPPSLNAPEGSP